MTRRQGLACLALAVLAVIVLIWHHQTYGPTDGEGLPLDRTDGPTWVCVDVGGEWVDCYQFTDARAHSSGPVLYVGSRDGIPR